MTWTVRLTPAGQLEFMLGGRAYVSALSTDVPAWSADDRPTDATPWARRLPPTSEPIYESVLTRDGEPVLEQRLIDFGTHALFRARVLRPLEGIATVDSFAVHAMRTPVLRVDPSLRTMAVTYGLGDADDPYGGYWPRVEIGNATSLPNTAFAPLVLWGPDGALAIAPANGFMTGSLTPCPGGVARGIHGAIDRLDEGAEIETLLVPGPDVASALMALGDHLLARGGKRRPDPSDHRLTSTIGWWNAYGGYYTEPIHPLRGDELERVIEDIDRRRLPIGYLGIDLWYPYDAIGQGIEFVPDPAKYPKGLGRLASRIGLPTVLHVSALAQPNAYGSDGSDGSIYAQIAEAVCGEEGQVVWHDWMRTQQHLTPQLRRDPTSAEAWYREMASCLARRNLEVLQCMQTMGMALASTQAANVRSARAFIDYLFSLPEAIDTLAGLGDDGFRREAVRPVDLNRQNLLMGTVLYALGLLPFHDLFLTSFHEGIGGAQPIDDAILRALSCGPVGIGDAPERADRELLDRLILPDGRLLQPDRPPFPTTETLGEPIEAYWTQHRAGSQSWYYGLLLNVSTEGKTYDVAPPGPGAFAIRDGKTGCLVERMGGSLEPGGVAYYVLSPTVDGISPLGLLDKFVPAPAGGILKMSDADGVTLTLQELEGDFGIHSLSELRVTADGVPLSVRRGGSVHHVAITPDHKTLRIHRR